MKTSKFPSVAKRCGPGKFEGETAIERAVWELSMDGCESIGDVETIGWYGRIDFDQQEQAELALVVDEDGDPYFAEAPASAIVREDSQGFVDVRFYGADEVKVAWARIERIDAEVVRGNKGASMDAKQPVKVVGGKPLTYEVQGEVIEAGKGAEKAALKHSLDVPPLKYEFNGRRVDLTRDSFEAAIWHAYVQGRADEAATRGDSK